MKKTTILRLAVIIGIPVLFAFIVRGLFGVKDWSSLYTVMSVAFIVILPVGVGALTIYLSDIESVKSRAYRFFIPWLPIGVFFLLTILFNVEGWACWIMVLPIFLIASSLGGVVAGHYKLRKNKREKLYVSFIALLPFLIAPVEQAIGKIPGQYQAYTYTDIKASPDSIWSHVTRVKAIDPQEDAGWFTNALGFPRPLHAELNYEGVGAYRKAVFDKGLVFDETVLEYEPLQKMVFSIKANPYDIPSTTMDEHIVVGGPYFDVLNGTYELKPLSATTYRLHLYSHFKLTTTFNFYASWWAGWIMQDIQNNILQVIKKRAEATAH